MTSFGAVARVRRLFGLKKVGHCGTLDPFADGVLTICLGSGTAAVQYMEVYDKGYLVTFRLGRTTDTQDVEGETVSVHTPSEADIERLLADDSQILRQAFTDMVGTQEQTPPIYSALKLDGRPLYSYARAGEKVDLEKKRRTITVLDASFVSARIDWEGDPLAPLEVRARIHCSKGTYIRTLIHDLGERLGFGAYCTALTREMSGPYRLEDSYTLEQLETLMPENKAEHPALGLVDQALAYLPMLELSEKSATRFANGQFIGLDAVLRADDALYEAIEAAPNEEDQQASRAKFRVLAPGGLIGVAYLRDVGEPKPVIAAERVFVRNE